MGNLLVITFYGSLFVTYVSGIYFTLRLSLHWPLKKASAVALLINLLLIMAGLGVAQLTGYLGQGALFLIFSIISNGVSLTGVLFGAGYRLYQRHLK